MTLYIEVEFTLQQDEEFTHPQEYLVNGKFRVRAVLSRSKISEKHRLVSITVILEILKLI